MSRVRTPEPEPALDDDALAMLRAYRAQAQIPAALHERVWSRVQADVAAPRRQWLRYGVAIGGLAAAALAVLWVGGQVLRPEPTVPGNQAGYEQRAAPERGVVEPAPARPGTHEPAPKAAPSSPPRGDDEPAAPVPAASGPHEPTTARGGLHGGATGSVRRPAPDDASAPLDASAGSTLAAENRLLAQARAALIEGEPSRALGRLDEHARRFPDGVLSEERQALRAVALCEAGREAEGDAAARAFLRAHPQAALAERVRNACQVP